MVREDSGHTQSRMSLSPIKARAKRIPEKEQDTNEVEFLRKGQECPARARLLSVVMATEGEPPAPERKKRQ